LEVERKEIQKPKQAVAEGHAKYYGAQAQKDICHDNLSESIVVCELAAGRRLLLGFLTKKPEE
jgi:hypothetical protein